MRRLWWYVLMALLAVAVVVWPRFRPASEMVVREAPADVMPPWQGALALPMPGSFDASERGRSLAQAIDQITTAQGADVEDALNALATCCADQSDEVAWRAAACLAETLMDHRTNTPHLVSKALIRALSIRPRRLPELESDLIQAWEPLLQEALGSGTAWFRTPP